MKHWLKIGLIGSIVGFVLAALFTLQDILKEGPTEQICAFNTCPSFCPCKIGLPWLDPLLFQAITMFVVFIVMGFIFGVLISWVIKKVKKMD